MTRSRRLASLTVALFAFGFAFLGTAQPAHSAVRLGVDGIWVPLSADQVESGDTSLDSSHKVSSFGASAHAGVGFEIFSASLKLNYFNEGLEVEDKGSDGESSSSVRRDQVDINAMARIGVPATKLGLFAEGGGSLSTSFDGLGYNIGLGAEYGVFSIPLLTFNVGIEGQYVNLPANLNGASTDNKTWRGLFFVGVDFGL